MLGVVIVMKLSFPQYSPLSSKDPEGPVNLVKMLIWHGCLDH